MHGFLFFSSHSEINQWKIIVLWGHVNPFKTISIYIYICISKYVVYSINKLKRSNKCNLCGFRTNDLQICS